MHLSDDRLRLVHDLIANLYSRLFDEALVLDTAQSVCELVDAQYFSLVQFQSRNRSRLSIVSNNPPEYIPIYLSVWKKDFIIESVIARGWECVLTRIPDYDRPEHQEFIKTVQYARPISDLIYVPIRIDSVIYGHWSLARTGLQSPCFTEDELALFRFITSFLNDTLERPLFLPPIEDDIAYLDYDGRIVGSGNRIQEVFDTLFGHGHIDEAGTGGELWRVFGRRYRNFLHRPMKIGMDKLDLRVRGRQFLFSFNLIRTGIVPMKQKDSPHATARLLETSLKSTVAVPAEQAVASGHFEFSRLEHEVLNGIFRGKTNKEIEQSLGIDESTVKRYTHNIYEKTGFRSHVELVLWLQGV
jgi:DNA-binding CsgD family transcriptional regulator